MSQLLSIVIPMFNATHTIEGCIDSILDHITSETEVLIIDDGSTDDGATKVKNKYASQIQSGALSIYSQKNQGVSAARNTGIDHAKGRYIAFVDADDHISDQYIAELTGAINSSACDIIEFGFNRWDGKSDFSLVNAEYTLPNFGIFQMSEVDRQIFGISNWYPWARIYNRNLFSELRFPLGVSFCEDLMTISQAFRSAKTICSLEKILYHYRINPLGATATVRPVYVDNLTKYYLSIIGQRDDCMDLLKIAVYCCIYECQRAMGVPYGIDYRISKDLSRLRTRFSLLNYIDRRTMRILWFPRLNRFLSKLLRGT
jgi:glycosyltransferase involved in cell wall biosynthesis